MLHFRKTILAIILSISMIVTMIPSCAFAAEDDYEDIVNGLSANTEINPDANKDPFDFEEGISNQSNESEMLTDSVFPEQYDLRDKGVVTPVKYQNPFGTCWGFASIAAAETSILSELGKTYEEFPIDLSELHLTYFALGHIEDENDSQYGEGHWCTDDDDVDIYPWMRLNQGGDFFFSTNMFASGIGPVYEEDVPYRNKSGYIYWRLRDDQGKTVDLKDSIESPGEGYVPIYYSDYVAEDISGSSWAVDESLKNKQEYELEEGLILPSPAGKDDEGNYKYNAEATNAIKEQIYKGNAVQISFYADTSKPNEDGEAQYLNNNTWAHYTYDIDEVNHGVTIVGWDDSYSKDNFNSMHQPPEDGAWLVKNSWGAETNEFPNKGSKKWGIEDENGISTGYFWISYYDTSLTRPETLDFYTGEAAAKENTSYIDAYDYMPVSDIGNMLTDKSMRMANVFTAKEDINLRAVSCQTATPGSAVFYRIYILDDNHTTPEGLQPVATVLDSFKYGGYHRTALDNPVTIRKGQRYAVEVEIKTPSKQHEVLISRAYNEKGKVYSLDAGYSKGVVNPGESLLYTGEKYLDWTDVLEGVCLNDGEIYDYDNFAIKAYADPVNLEPEEVKPVISKAKISMTKSGKKYVKFTWKKLKNVKGYQVAYRKKGSSKWNYKTVSKTTFTKSKLKKNTEYQIKVRGYAYYKGDRAYGKWSDIKSVKTKK